MHFLSDNNNNNFIFRCQAFKPLWGGGDLSHERHTHKHKHVSEGLQFSVLIREDTKV